VTTTQLGLSAAAAALFALAPLLGAARVAAPAASDDVALKLKSIHATERVAAVDAIRRDGAKDAEKLLLDALDDKDWEVMEHAAAALGERGSATSVEPLSKLTLDGPVRRVRLAAVRAMTKLDAKAAADQLTKAAKGVTLQRACEGLAVVAETDGEAARAGLQIGWTSKDAPVRAAAAAGLHAFPPAERSKQTLEFLKESDLTIGAAALDSARKHPDAGVLPALFGALSAGTLPDVFERRADQAIVALLAATPKEKRGEIAARIVGNAKGAGDPARTRFARLLGLAAAKRGRGDGKTDEDSPLLPADEAIAVLDPIASRGADDAAAAAARALARIATDSAFDKLAAIAAGSPSPRVKSIALRGIAAGRQELDAPTIEAVKRCLTDRDLDVREDAVVALGKPGTAGAVEALVPLLKDEAWEVAVAAAVSLGKTRDPGALPPLQQLLSHKDWKLKAAALVGLGHSKQKAAVPLLIEALAGKSPSEKISAYEALRRITRDKVTNKQASWKTWWSKNENSFQFPDLSEAAKQQQKYGYAPTSYGVYEDLDVLVFQSRGDHIEKLLDKMKIEHRETHGGGVTDAGVAPHGVYVANCTGEASPDDLEQVRWFVHAGGYLFNSCWALTYHAAEVRPGFGRKFETGERDVLDLVTAEPCADSPYLAGVFDGVTKPKYVLEGAHLLEVLDPDRVEVLIDSPECATRHRGGGNLAGWWTIGHGLILDSVNHFDLQGFDRAPQMKEPAERMAYAVDVMGLSFSDLRDVPKAAWASQTKAADEVRDLSAFRFITNFVRQKRRAGS
jgi:HEAT repeat protein